MQVLETVRLRLRRLTPEDAPFILGLLNDPQFLRFVGDKGVRTRDDAEFYLRQGPMASYERHGFGLYLVTLKEGGAPIGMGGLLKRDMLEDVDVGFAFLPQFSGHGYATEAARATLHHAHTALGLARIVAITAPANVASQHVLKKIGLRYEKTLRLPAYPTDSLLFTPAAD